MMPQEDYEPGSVWDDELTLCSSSNVKGFRRSGYNGIDLDVTFKATKWSPERTWHYPHAGEAYEDMLFSHSKGKFVAYVLRRNYGDGQEIVVIS